MIENAYGENTALDIIMRSRANGGGRRKKIEAWK